jgi:hypothetical protein
MVVVLLQLLLLALLHWLHVLLGPSGGLNRWIPSMGGHGSIGKAHPRWCRALLHGTCDCGTPVIHWLRPHDKHSVRTRAQGLRKLLSDSVALYCLSLIWPVHRI